MISKKFETLFQRNLPIKNSDIKVPASLLGISNWNETYSQHITRDCSMSRKVISNKRELALRIFFSRSIIDSEFIFYELEKTHYPQYIITFLFQ